MRMCWKIHEMGGVMEQTTVEGRIGFVPQECFDNFSDYLHK